ncbi:hypothetical protein ACFL6P_01135 [Candidatus Latescibacterota bacterium]
MKKHTYYLIMISLVLLFIFLCYSGTPLNAESPNSVKGFLIRSPKNYGREIYYKHKNIPDKLHNTQKKKISKSFSHSKPISFIKMRMNQPPDNKNRWQMPEMIVRNDVDYKILKMHVNPGIDYKILQTGPKASRAMPGIQFNN